MYGRVHRQGSLCPDYNEEELLQMAREDPKARVMVPVPLRQANTADRRLGRTGTRSALQEGLPLEARELELS